MANKTLKLFYVYARADEALRKQLDNHLATLKNQKLLESWSDKQISAGTLRQKEIDTRLKSADIILLLVSADFLSSDYCNGVEVQEALRRHEAGEARVVPILLRPCDWESAIFGTLQALPRNGRPVTIWDNCDEAFTEVARELRALINDLNGTSQDTDTVQVTGKRKRQQKTGEEVGKGMTMVSMPEIPKTSTALSAPLKKAITRYYAELKEYEGKADYELALRSAFQNLLAEGARQVKWTLIPEQTLEGGIRPDGVLRDTFNLYRGYWEAKGPKSDLDKEIAKKKADGYPLVNTIFENTRNAVLYQNKRPLPVEYDLRNPHDVGDLLIQFLTYTEPDIATFEAAVQEFKERIPELAKGLLSIIEKEHKQNKRFIAAFDTFANLCRTSLDPKISTDAIDEMLIQHLLTERLLRKIFNNSDFVNRNVIAAEIEKVIQALASRSFNRDEFLKSLDRFYIAIEGAARGREN
jgi:hypothetical protein